MTSYANKPMSFSFKKPDGAKAKPETMAEESAETESTAMSSDEMGAAVKAAMSTGGDALYQAIARIVDHCKE